MTLIGGRQQALSPTVQSSSLGSGVGQSFQVAVVGPMRQGVLIASGRETFSLQLPIKLADASKLTLEMVASTSSGQKVRILAVNDRPMSKPIIGQLSLGSVQPPVKESVVFERSRIRINALPVDLNGQTIGPKIRLELQTVPATLASGTHSLSLPSTQPPFNQPTGIANAENGTLANTTTYENRPGTAMAKVMSADGVMNFKGTPTYATPWTSTVDSFGQITHMQTSEMVMRHQQSYLPTASSSVATSIGGHSTEMEAAQHDALSDGPSSIFKGAYQVSKANDVPQAFERTGAALATIVSRTDAGFVVLEAADRFLRLEQHVDLPIGTKLYATIVSPTNQNQMETSGALLRRLIDYLNLIDMQGRQFTDADQPSVERRTPTADKYLASRFLDLISASENRSKADALGLSMYQGRNSSSSIRDHIHSLIRELGDRASEHLEDGWRSLVLPIESNHGPASYIYFANRSFDSDEGESVKNDAEREENRRAVFDLSFSYLGRCQIDAFYQQKRFDLILRSETEFDSENQHYIASIFEAACEISGLNGEIGFKIGNFFEPPRSPVAVKDLKA